MTRLLAISVLAIPLFFHLGCTDTLSERQFDDDNNFQLGNKNSRHGKHLILDNERRMTTKFDAKIRSKNTNVNDDKGRLEERARLLRGMENRQYDETTRHRSGSRIARRDLLSRQFGTEIHPDRSLKRQNNRRLRNRENDSTRNRVSDARERSNEIRFESRLSIERDRESSGTEARNIDTVNNQDRRHERIQLRSNERVEEPRLSSRRKDMDNERISGRLMYEDNRNEDRTLRTAERRGHVRDELKTRMVLRRREERDNEESRRNDEDAPRRGEERHINARNVRNDNVERRSHLRRLLKNGEDAVRNDNNSNREMMNDRRHVDRVSTAVRRNVIARGRQSKRLDTRRMESEERRREEEYIRQNARESENRNDLRDSSSFDDADIRQRDERRFADQRTTTSETNDHNIRRESQAMSDRINLVRVSDSVRRNVVARTRSDKNVDLRRSAEQSRRTQSESQRRINDEHRQRNSEERLDETRSVRNRRERDDNAEINQNSNLGRQTRRESHQRVLDRRELSEEREDRRLPARKERIEENDILTRAVRDNLRQETRDTSREGSRVYNENKRFQDTLREGTIRKDGRRFARMYDNDGEKRLDNRDSNIVRQRRGEMHQQEQDRRHLSDDGMDRRSTTGKERVDETDIQSRTRRDALRRETREPSRIESRRDNENNRFEEVLREDAYNNNDRRVERRYDNNEGRRSDNRNTHIRRQNEGESRKQEQDRRHRSEDRREREINVRTENREREDIQAGNRLDDSRLEARRFSRIEPRRDYESRRFEDSLREDVNLNNDHMFKRQYDNESENKLDNRNTPIRREREGEIRKREQDRRRLPEDRRERVRTTRIERVEEVDIQAGTRRSALRIGRRDISRVESRRNEQTRRSEEVLLEDANRNNGRRFGKGYENDGRRRLDNRNSYTRRQSQGEIRSNEVDRRNLSEDGGERILASRKARINGIEVQAGTRRDNLRREERDYSRTEIRRDNQNRRIQDKSHEDTNRNNNRRLERDNSDADERRMSNRNTIVKDKTRRESRDDISNRRVLSNDMAERRITARDERNANNGIERRLMRDDLRRVAREAVRVYNPEVNQNRRIHDIPRISAKRDNDRRLEREYDTESQRRFGDQRHDQNEIKNQRRDSTNEAQIDIRRVTKMDHEDRRTFQYKQMDASSNERRSEKSNTADSLKIEEYASLNPKYFDSMNVFFGAPEYLVNLRSLMKVGGKAFLENVDTTLVTQLLLGGMTMALMWNKKQVHGGF